MMNLSNKGISSNVVTSPNASNKVPTNLNPNAAEFIPFALRSPIGTTGTGDVAGNVDASGTSGKAILDRSDSNNSDDEAHQYWRRQLPDDITPDFKFMGEDGADSISFASLSVNDVSENSRFPVSTGSGHILSKRQELSAEMHYPGAQYGEDHLSAGFPNLAGSPWEKRFLNADQNLTNGRQSVTYNGNSQNLTNGRQGVTYNANSGVGFVNDGLSEHAIVDDSEINPVDFLASQFPGFAAESLAEVYYANGYDLNLTIEMLTQLELQVDSGFNPNLTSKTLSAPNLSALDFPALSESDSQNGLTKYDGDDLPQSATPYKAADKDSMFFFKTSSVQSRGPIDFASVVKKPASQDSGQWKYERNGSANVSVGSSRSSQVLASSYHGSHGGSAYGDRLQNYGSARGAPTWLETGEAVANMYSELREEARDYARLRNAYFDQAQQAYISGNKALAKELSLKGQLHNMQMKAAHAKAQESIYRQRNPTRAELQAYGRGQEQMIDLHGLHVSEAIHRLRGELSVLRSAARSADQCLQVYICVGTGHHTKGSRTPARLPVTVEQYLLQEEGLDYTEPQPGLLRVVVY